MRLKKILSIILVILTLSTTIFSSSCSSCFREETIEDFVETFESDGTLLYRKHYYQDKGERKFYYDVGGQESLELPKKVYVPPYYKGVPVVFIGAYRRTGGTPDLIFPTFNNVESLYLPYNSGGLRQGGIPYTYIKEREKSLDYFSTLDIGPKNIYFLFSRTTLLETWIQTKSDYAGIENFYIPNFRFEEVKKAFKLLCKNKTDCSLIFEKNPPILDTFFVIRANTTYYFNYEESPNEDIFFINDFERGEKIENTPYEPTREGYKFKGWYKEPECVNAWNFEEDRLPAPEYYENGELKYVETCLYAKWEKN